MYQLLWARDGNNKRNDDNNNNNNNLQSGYLIAYLQTSYKKTLICIGFISHIK